MVEATNFKAFRLSDAALLVLLAAFLATAAGYFLIVDGWKIFTGNVGYSSGGIAVLVAMPVYLWIFWKKREQHVALDYHMLYLPLATWLLAFFIYKVAMWRVTRGQSFYLTYGWDKGFQNFLLEPAIVVVMSGVYLARFAASQREPVARRFAIGTLVVAALIAILFPPLGE